MHKKFTIIGVMVLKLQVQIYNNNENKNIKINICKNIKIIGKTS